MKILLVKLEDPDCYQLYPPYGLMYISSALKLGGYDPVIFHERATGKNVKLLLKQAKNSLFVGFSVITSPSLIYNLDVSKNIKKLEIPVVWGGVHPTILPEITLKDKCIDYVVIGEGEETIIELAKVIEGRKNIDEVEGIGYRKHDEIIVKERRGFIQNLDMYSACWSDVDIKKYYQKRYNFKKILPFLTSRGCPHRCKFCYNLAVHHKKWRAHSKDFVVKEIKRLEDFGIEGLIFYDDNFFTDKKRAFSILSDINYPWFAEVRADYIDEEFIKNVKKYGCQELFIGAESGSDKVLNIIQKDITTRQIENVVKICDKYNIRTTLSFMIGLPGETESDRHQTLDFMYMMDKNYKKVNLDGPKIYTPYPGTPLYEEIKKHGFKEPTTSEEWSRNFFRFKCNLPWIEEKERMKMELLYYMVQLAQMKTNPLTFIPKKLEDFRWRNKNFVLPIELELTKKLSNKRLFTKIFFKYIKSVE